MYMSHHNTMRLSPHTPEVLGIKSVLAHSVESLVGLRPPHSLTLLTHLPLSLASLEDAFMQKVLQPQVAHAAFTLNPHRETEAVERAAVEHAPQTASQSG